MYWYFKYDRIFLLSNLNKSFYYKLLKFTILIFNLLNYDIILFLNSVILGLLVFKNITEISIIILNLNNLILELNFEITIIIILN